MFASGAFLDFQKAFDTVNHESLQAKLQHYGVRGVPLNWFKSYLEDCAQYTDINNTSSQILEMKIADDTNLLYNSKCLKDINKKVNFELKNIVHCLRANNISLNTRKTDLILFRSKRKKTKRLNFRISGQKIKIAFKTKYLGLLLDETLNFKNHIDSSKTILRRANCILSEIRHYVKKNIFRTTYYGLFDSHLRCACQIWGQC